MNPLVEAHLAVVVESSRFLQRVVTLPSGLRSDFRALRESLETELETDPPSGGNVEPDDGTAATTDENLQVALPSIESMSASIDALAGWAAAGVPSLSAGQFDRARNVLAQAAGQVAAGLRASAAARVRGLYVIVDPEATRGRPILDVAEAALRGGASVVQLRDKSRDKGEMLPDALRLQAMCEDYGGLFVVNDDADLARAVSSHALHVGQTDLPVASARAVLDARQLVGTSNGDVAEALRSQADGADYVAVGAIFGTTTMGKSGRRSLGVEAIAEVKEAVSMPVVAIGGINLANIADVVRAGADCVCVVSAVTFADDPEAAAAHLVEAIRSAAG